MNHTIQSELRTCITRHSKTVESPLEDRNANMILYYYGFGDSTWPSLEDTAHTWGLGTRERFRQIKDRFLQFARGETLPSLMNFISLVGTSPYWVQTELSRRLVDAGLVDGQFSLCGLFNLVRELELDFGYEIYTPGLKRATRSSVNRFEEYFIMRPSDHKEIATLYKRARRAPGRMGLARLRNVTPAAGMRMSTHGVVERLVVCSDDAWTERTESGIWYLFENRDNVFFNNTEKVFSVFSQCNVFDLAEAHLRSLGRYRKISDLPPVETVARYLRSSGMFNVDEDVVRYTGGSKRTLSPIEYDVLEFLQDKADGCKHADISSYLRAKGHTQDYIRIIVAHSPLLRVDKTGGKGSYRYYLVGRRAPVSRGTVSSDDSRYATFARRLLKLSTTDAPVMTKRRMEQEILRSWLFDDKKTQLCAICGKRYRVEALVAAHKKKRSKSNAVERRDPRIVMPLCVFGCDFVYENRFVRIEDGIVVRGTASLQDDASEEYVRNLLGARVVPEWLRGPLYYFGAQRETSPS